MAELDIQRKEGGVPWYGWLIGLLVALAIGWLIVDALWDNDANETATGTNQTMNADRGNEAAALPVAEIVSAPANFDNRRITGAATVASVVSDRGFWVEENGQRMFVVLDQQNEAVDVNAGQRVRLSGQVMNANEARNMPGVQSLEQQTRQILEQQGAFLYVDSPQGISIGAS